MKKQQPVFNFNHFDPKLTEIEVSELKTVYKFDLKKWWLYEKLFKFFKDWFSL